MEKVIKRRCVQLFDIKHHKRWITHTRTHTHKKMMYLIIAFHGWFLRRMWLRWEPWKKQNLCPPIMNYRVMTFRKRAHTHTRRMKYYTFEKTFKCLYAYICMFFALLIDTHNWLNCWSEFAAFLHHFVAKTIDSLVHVQKCNNFNEIVDVQRIEQMGTKRHINNRWTQFPVPCHHNLTETRATRSFFVLQKTNNR